MRINFNKQTNFKGYDAIPLKKLHMSNHYPIVKKQLENTLGKEGVEICSSIYNEFSNQDFVTILEKQGKVSVLMSGNDGIFKPDISKVEQVYNMPIDYRIWLKKDSPICGGNFFIGKNEQGEKWMLIGTFEKFGLSLDEISKMYDIKQENIHFIPQQDYHLDMSIRPIGYPYVLVNDPSLVLKNQHKIKDIKPLQGIKLNEDDKKVAAFNNTIRALEECGFKPIPIAGVYANGINFMNAIVNKHPDGSISYITNSSRTINPYTAEFQKMFKRDLKNKLSEINKRDGVSFKLKDIYFISGEIYKDIELNEMMENVLEGHGGIHCLTAEEPDFNVLI